MTTNESEKVPTYNLAEGAQQMAPTVWIQDDLHKWNDSGWFDPCIHVDCKLLIEVERWFY